MTVPEPPAGVRLVGRRFRFADHVVFVRDAAAGAEVRVRVVSRGRRRLYLCDVHGRQDQPGCIHALSAAQLTRPSTAHH